ncbi:MAG: TIGR04157 family glycosyltransferase [Bacteroidales bacterium]|jgi:glycosyltransferase|nr:TIGR04157 family glycosyltransferase [Bacteroidales bacterium]
MKKKKLYIFNATSRAAAYGIGSYIDQLLNALKNTDWEFTLVWLQAQGNNVEIEEKEGYKQINIPFPHSQVENAGEYYNRNIAYLLKEFITEEKNIEPVFHLNFMTNPGLVKQLKKHFRCKIILVSHYTDWSFSLLGDYSRLKKILQKPKKELKDKLEKAIVKGLEEDVRMINKVNCFVCVAQHTLDEFQKSGNIQQNKTQVINNALEDVYTPLPDKEKSVLRKKYHLEEDTKVILFAGRLDEVKGIAYLIRAFQKVLVAHPDSRLLIAGEGNFNEWLKESADCWSKITFTGRIDKKKLYELYSLADMGIACSLHEEFGLVAIEMMMHELPLIVTKTGGLDEIVEDGISGLKIPVRTLKGNRQIDVNGLAGKINYLLDHPSQAKELGKNGRKRFLEKYEWSLFKEKMINLYNNI